MILTEKMRVVGLVPGVALFLTAGMLAMAGAGANPGAAFLKAGPTDPKVTAPARSVGETFMMVANVRDSEQVLATAKNKNQVLRRVARSGGKLFMALQMKWEI